MKGAYVSLSAAECGSASPKCGSATACGTAPLDSSGRLDSFAGGPGAVFFAPAVAHRARLAVPALSLFEVVRRVLSRSGEAAADVVGAMHEGFVVDPDEDLTFRAAKLTPKRSR